MFYFLFSSVFFLSVVYRFSDIFFTCPLLYYFLFFSFKKIKRWVLLLLSLRVIPDASPCPSSRPVWVLLSARIRLEELRVFRRISRCTRPWEVNPSLSCSQNEATQVEDALPITLVKVWCKSVCLSLAPTFFTPALQPQYGSLSLSFFLSRSLFCILYLWSHSVKYLVALKAHSIQMKTNVTASEILKCLLLLLKNNKIQNLTSKRKLICCILACRPGNDKRVTPAGYSSFFAGGLGLGAGAGAGYGATGYGASGYGATGYGISGPQHLLPGKVFDLKDKYFFYRVCSPDFSTPPIPPAVQKRHESRKKKLISAWCINAGPWDWTVSLT